MATTDFIALIASIISVLISSGALVALFQIRSVNAKNLAEARRAQAEADQKAAEDKVNAFRAQVDAANTLSETMSKRLDSLSNRVILYEQKENQKDSEVAELKIQMERTKHEAVSIKRKIDAVNKLFNELVEVIRIYLNHHSQCLITNCEENKELLAKLEKEVEAIENQYKELELSN